MKEFILKSRQTYNSNPTDECRICEMLGTKRHISHCIELTHPNGVAMGKGWGETCKDHIRNIANDVLKDADTSWRIYVEPPARVHSDAAQRTALDAIDLAGKIRRAEINQDEAADALKSLVLRVHEAALTLRHYENMNGGNDHE